MAQIVTNNFSIQNASNFISSYQNNYYLVIGRPQQWLTEPTAPSPVNLTNQDFVYWADAIAAKRIVLSSIKQVIKRTDYASGVVYTQYDHTQANLYSTNFCVLTLPEYNVYKCISNNFGSISTAKPSGKSTSIVQTADGYRWKYMYSLTDADLLKFLTTNYMAINVNDDVVSTAVPGTIDSIVITNQGVGYASNVTSNIFGTGAQAIVSNISINSSGSLTSMTINPAYTGRNYTFANVSIDRNGSNGVNAAAYAVISPVNGHGSDPLYELGAKYVMINSRLDYAEGGGDFPVVNDYRRIAIVKDPVSNTTGNIATEITLDCTSTLILANASSNFTLDEIIIGNTTNANALVVSSNIIGDNTYIRYIAPENLKFGNLIFSVGESISGNTSLTTAQIIGKSSPEVVLNTGKFLYVENRSKITRQSDQAENIHIVIEF
jgi:hypothetical protein